MARLPKSIRPRLEVLEDKTVPSTYFVLNSNDIGPGSLRQAVLDANGHAGADDIQFSGFAFPPINVASELAITDSVSVVGPAGGLLPVTVSGGGTTRVLSVAAGTTVSVRGLTIANGAVTGVNRGGGILNNGKLTLTDSLVTGSSAVQGGGIENRGTLSMIRSVLANNKATRNGAGLHTTNRGSATLDQSSVIANSCGGDGAGIRSESGTTLTILNSSIASNTASGFGTGGIASGGELTIRNSSINGNTSAAGAIYLMPSTTDVVISGTQIVGNGPSATSGSGVGGIWSYAFGGRIRIEDSTIASNEGAYSGGLYGYGQTDIARTQIINNTGGSVGGILARQPMRVVDSTISGNTGRTIGGIYSSYSLELTRSTVSNNTATPTHSTGAGGVFLFGSASIQNSTISGNTVVADTMNVGPYSYYSGAAGGVLAIVPGTTISNSTIAFNEVRNAPATISQVSGGVTGMDFSFTGYYGGTYEFHAEVGVRNTIIARNSATNRDPDVTGSFVSGGHNLVGVLTAAATGFVASDLRGSTATPLDPRLFPLSYSGGFTQTHLLMSGSPAFNAGDNAGNPVTDQRGFARIVGGTIDIGAVEMNGLIPPVGGGFAANKHKPKPSKKPPSWTPIQGPAKSHAWSAMMHKRGISTAAQVAEHGKIALPDLGIRLRLSATDLVDPTGLDLTL